eukprot:GGOE01022806.1.p1 GENE.GGOE01022806.1~~GGOE01022806.1.p1  ORF type:complete len:328 (-),score=101.56 GGOE01022806.1:355-1338(-)
MWLRQHGQSIIICGLYCAVGVMLSILNGWLFLHTPMKFPWTMTVFHMATMFLMTVTLNRGTALCGKELFTLHELPADSCAFLRQMLGVLVAINIGLNNFSLQFINAAMNQIIKAAMPVTTALLAKAFLQREVGLRSWTGLVGISLGIAVTCFQNPHFQSFGVLLCCGSLIAGSVQLTAAEKLLRNTKLDSLSFVYQTSLWSLLFLLPIATSVDLHTFIVQFRIRPAAVSEVVVITSLLAFLNVVLMYATISCTSSTFTCVASCVKLLATIVLQNILFPVDNQNLEPHHIIGATMTIVCFCFLSTLQFGKPATTPTDNQNKEEPAEAV